ncbi:hypothetical protein L0B53_15415 [Vibrio sp. SS-MA-C1-2]|uniref:hypothetical protein n=1 Tax=Vibrio sp. SS-MA-C1-2 TaxID=2908646 RepID=UPI001F3E7C01|nr:hypothetical protein [Vibrio sp. SS-MA-C1-2]UJF18395.1 hypothetical protein L0B53_15415 [Vibrio sp. SS-MA-C1-2]
MTIENRSVSGSFIQLNDERFYIIKNYDEMPPFFISLVSSDDHWMFLSSSGSLTAGRVKPEFALFPYKSVDYIHESSNNTGSYTTLKVTQQHGVKKWQPFNHHHDGIYSLERNLYKNSAGDKIIYEEKNHDLAVTFRYQWASSEKYGFVRTSTLINEGTETTTIDILDGLQNLLPTDAPLSAMNDRSALVDAYKWNERRAESALAIYSMYAKLSDKAEPAESMLATTVFTTSTEAQAILLSSQQVKGFNRGADVTAETLTKGVRGAFLLNFNFELAAKQQKEWQIVADVNQSHSDIIALENELQETQQLTDRIVKSVAENQEELLRFMATTDGLQTTNDQETTVHHYANVLFNNLRGGVSLNQYQIDRSDLLKTINVLNKPLFERYQHALSQLDETLSYSALLEWAQQQQDNQLTRVVFEYLPLTFGRRHGDPSRPWNHFEIKVKDEQGDRKLSYQGNWRDIFQNWEALAVSYPNFIESFIAKFVNASTIDGYNPYRITKEGIDWELLEPDDPWSNIGYWGDHQIIYLLKFLELSKKFNPARLQTLLAEDIFAYANVPYEIKGFKALLDDPKDTVNFNDQKQLKIEALEKELGSDARLLLNADNSVYQVNLTEKLLVPLLSKMSNFVLGGGIWLNTQRPEWNDANNAIVGNGLSMVTLYYIRRYLKFIKALYQSESEYPLSSEVAQWLTETIKTLSAADQKMQTNGISDPLRTELLHQLGEVGEQYRETIYQQEQFSGKKTVTSAQILTLCDVSLSLIDETIAVNKRQDGMYNAYNIADFKQPEISVSELYPMLEGQVSVLSSGYLNAEQSIELLETLFASDIYRQDQQSFMLYPDRDLTHFQDKNRLTQQQVNENPLLVAMLEKNDPRVISQAINGDIYFNASFENAKHLKKALEKAKGDYSEFSEPVSEQICDLYEVIFNHQSFTGRSGTMFGYEGLGCIYWHMVSKLLLASQEAYNDAVEQQESTETINRLRDLYYRVRAGISFNKTPLEYGAFPTDPYSHTPKQAGAQQPGMTGQVKEEILTRFSELGLYVEQGVIKFSLGLLQRSELLVDDETFIYAAPSKGFNQLPLHQNELGFTFCQTPIVYTFNPEKPYGVEIYDNEGLVTQQSDYQLSRAVSEQIFNRQFTLNKLVVNFNPEQLF